MVFHRFKARWCYHKIWKTNRNANYAAIMVIWLVIMQIWMGHWLNLAASCRQLHWSILTIGYNVGWYWLHGWLQSFHNFKCKLWKLEQSSKSNKIKKYDICTDYGCWCCCKKWSLFCSWLRSGNGHFH